MHGNPIVRITLSPQCKTSNARVNPSSTIHERDWRQFHAPNNLAVALSVEASEILGILQWKKNDEELTEEEQQALAHEIGNVLIYLLELADKFDIDPVQAVYIKLQINAKKYPADKVRDKAKKYTDD